MNFSPIFPPLYNQAKPFEPNGSGFDKMIISTHIVAIIYGLGIRNMPFQHINCLNVSEPAEAACILNIHNQYISCLQVKGKYPLSYKNGEGNYGH